MRVEAFPRSVPNIHIPRRAESLRQGTTVAPLDSQYGVRLTAEAIAGGGVAVIGYGATYGTASSLESRTKMAVKRGEKVDKLEWISGVSTVEMVNWLVDKDCLHPQVRDHFHKLVEAATGVSFIRFPVDPKKAELLDPKNSAKIVNNAGEIQVFPVEGDPLLNRLQVQYGIPFYVVRSSNITGEPEETQFDGAFKYAQKIGADVFAPLYQEAVAKKVETERLRETSQPIFSVPGITDEVITETGYPVPIVKILRPGNTHPYTLSLLIRHHVPHVRVIEQAEKSNKGRPMYISHDVPLSEIRKDLLKASGI